MSLQPEFYQLHPKQEDELWNDEFPRNTIDCFSSAIASGAFMAIFYGSIGAIGGYFMGDLELGAYLGAGMGAGIGLPLFFALSISKVRDKKARQEFERNQNKGIDSEVN